MKNVLVLLLVGLMVVSCGSTKEMEEEVVVETPTEKIEPTAQTMTRHKRGGVDAEQLAAQLDLTVDQEELFIDVWNNTTEAFKNARIDNKDDKSAMIAAMKAVRETRNAEFSKILTSAQLAKYYEIMQSNRGKNLPRAQRRRG